MYSSTKTTIIIVVLIAIICTGTGIVIGQDIWGDNLDIAPTYALDKTTGISCGENPGDCWFTTQFSSGELRYFWQEATKNTQFTVDGKPVEITDVQVFYKKGWYSHDSVNTLLGNITYYPNGIEYSQTYEDK